MIHEFAISAIIFSRQLQKNVCTIEAIPKFSGNKIRSQIFQQICKI